MPYREPSDKLEMLLQRQLHYVRRSRCGVRWLPWLGGGLLILLLLVQEWLLPDALSTAQHSLFVVLAGLTLTALLYLGMTRLAQCLDKILQGQRELLQLFYSHPLPMWLQQQERLLAVNKAALTLYEVDVDQFACLSGQQLLGERLTGDENQPDSLRVLALARRDVPIRLWEVPLQLQETPSTLRIVQDMTAFQQAREAIQERERRYRQLIDYLPDGVLIQQHDYILFANPAAQQILCGRSSATVMGLPLWTFIREQSVPVEQVLPNDGCYMERRLRRLDGTEFDAEIASTPTLVDGKPAIQMIVRDISEAKALRTRLTDANHRLKYLSGKMLEIQEQERKAMSRELHDEVGQNLTALKIHLQMASRRQDKPVDWPQLVDIADRCVQQIRDMSLMLRPPQLDTLGLQAALQWHMDRLRGQLPERSSLYVAATLLGLSDHIQVALFRIVQEALNNIIKHAQAQVVEVRLQHRGNHISLDIEDDGRGFDINANNNSNLQGHASPHHQAGLGLISMSERAALLGGELQIVTSPGLGTRLHVTLPMHKGAV
ncbi:PAS domain-containing sensor histidine kinase [Pokkaliibacter plantistimulans]|nr:PAS domain-containing sensor histidine kinase [Pokkaliibacter plantistimulans]